jgi:hypothetical protein
MEELCAIGSYRGGGLCEARSRHTKAGRSYRRTTYKLAP